jgi:hypothetical protein
MNCSGQIHLILADKSEGRERVWESDSQSHHGKFFISRELKQFEGTRQGLVNFPVAVAGGVSRSCPVDVLNEMQFRKLQKQHTESEREYQMR